MNESLAAALAEIIKYLGATPILLFLAVMGLGPWAASIWIEYKRSGREKRDAKSREVERIDNDKRLQLVFERQDKRFEQVVQMYRDNISLVKDYETHVLNQRETNDKLIDLVSISTGTQTTLVDYIKSNMFCPLVKQAMRPGPIDKGAQG